MQKGLILTFVAFLLATYTVVAAVLFLVASATLWWMLHAWSTPDTLRGIGFPRGRVSRHRSFSLLVPARHEQAVLAATIDRLASLDYPDYEVVVVVGHDDHDTHAVAETCARRHRGRVRVVVDDSWPKNKPKALNTGLAHCSGDVVGVFDAEDEVDRRLLRQVDSCFEDTGADVVQGGVQLINFRSSWYALRNCLEYFFWFRSRLHLHARHGFIPLGGNTVFVRADLLRSAGAWDPDCLAEDCELGVRLSTLGAKVAVAYDPYSVTREETPGSLAGLLKQRTRWNQGFLQVLRKGVWRGLPTRRQRALARYTLAMPFLQAFTGVLVPISLATILLARVPVGLALLSFVPAIPTLATVAFEVAGLREFCRIYHRRARLRDYVKLILGTFPYQVLLAGAAVRAAVRELRGERGWEKTAHAGAHRVTPAEVPQAMSSTREGAAA